MKPSLESILAESLSGTGLKDLSAQTGTAAEETGPVEGLNVITSEQIAQDVIEHMKDERYKDPDYMSESCRAYLEENEVEHAQMRAQIQEVRAVVGVAMESMEMLSTIASMESVDDSAVAMANTAMSNIAQQYNEELPPILVAEDGVITTASMEGLVDWVKKALGGMKKWIVEKFQNMAINQRRSIVNRNTLLERAAAVQKRIQSMPSDYGIPAKQMRYNPRYVFALYANGAPLPFTKDGLGAAVAEATSIMEFGTKNIYQDSITRSDAIGDAIADILVARDEIAAEEKMRNIFKSVTQPMPIDVYLNDNKLREREVAGGMSFQDPAKTYRSNYRDAEWIMELVRIVDMNQAMVKFRQVGSIPSTVYDIPQLMDLLEVAGQVLDTPAMTDTGFYDELCAAWQQANQVYGRLMQMVTNMNFPHMNNELWRAMDVGVTAMFMFLEKAYNHTLMLRTPAYRVADGLLYVVEEQMKQYAAVNR